MADNDYPWPEPGRTFFDFQRTRPDAYNWMHPSLDEYAHMYRESDSHDVGGVGGSKIAPDFPPYRDRGRCPA